METTIKEFTLPIGPVHVALEEPMYFRLTTEGELVKKVEITSGHVHRGMEALATKRNFFQNIVLTERVCSLCSNSHPLTYCMALENLAEIKVPQRAQYLRVYADEIKRVASHLFNVAILAHIIGYKSLFMHMMEVREIMQDVKETVYGNRMDLAANCIGGVKYDVDSSLLQFVSKSTNQLKTHIAELIEIYQNDSMILKRTKGVGKINADEVRQYGLVGPVARGSGVCLDVRRDTPYAVYDKLKFNVITETGGDVHARAMVRLRETLESIHILEQVTEQMPEGSCFAELQTIPAGQAVARTEAPRGELFYYIRTDESDIPTRLKWRVPSYMNWEALKVMMKDCALADIPLIVNSIDPCVSCTER
ncbi:nickel-dependent hydrogenase large subunit [Desulfovibrio litoralis]|uniref:Ni,Fe-hydrogenase III large subunit n=1 Tax=Desulfovibrio litoralis DSM 11393 TaxID=1121455 RepID=A0A1M7S0Y5_9BACT|nr:nickel-dependent hydrogenase large subunit [Desulfovibrio litoralis]SHN52257.1 Ni,Fe-hydrogenase III large subunit [Desulfovibrio litoralis DSM 11393]